jgi:hypothetical protein
MLRRALHAPRVPERLRAGLDGPVAVTRFGDILTPWDAGVRFDDSGLVGACENTRPQLRPSAMLARCSGTGETSARPPPGSRR